jgi:hypothetical protein
MSRNRFVEEAESQLDLHRPIGRKGKSRAQSALDHNTVMSNRMRLQASGRRSHPVFDSGTAPSHERPWPDETPAPMLA